MAWIARDKNGDYHAFSLKPKRNDERQEWDMVNSNLSFYCERITDELAEIIVGRELRFEDEPVQVIVKKE